MTTPEVIAYLINADDAMYKLIVDTAANVRLQQEVARVAPAKRGRPKGSRKAKVNGAAADVCPTHHTPMTMYASGPHCNKCAQEGVR